MFFTVIKSQALTKIDTFIFLNVQIHHGNGIQELTYSDPNIFYLSIHRAAFGSHSGKGKRKKGRNADANDWFYPGTGYPSEIGSDGGEGTNLNVVWGEGGMGDEEYAAVFSQVILPLLFQLKPDLILIACGLDAVQGDLLGDCGLTPAMYYTMTRSIIEAAPKTPIVAALEGGYNIDKSAECMENVALALLDEPLEVEERKNFYSWSSASILPQRARVETTETAKLCNLARYAESYLGKHDMVGNNRRNYGRGRGSRRRRPYKNYRKKSKEGDDDGGAVDDKDHCCYCKTLQERESGEEEEEEEEPMKKLTKANVVAVKAIKRSATALGRKGGTCLCGCHFHCHHSNSLPPKKRKSMILFQAQRQSTVP